MLTLKQLTKEVTEDEALASILAILVQIGMQTASWQDGSIQLTILRLFARVYAALTTVIKEIASGGYLYLSSTDYLRLLAKYVFNLDYLQAQPTIGQVLLTSSAGAPTHTWIAGDIIVADAPQGTNGANSYTVTVGGTLNPGTATAFEFKADVAGRAANIAPGTTLYLWTPLVGVTPTNPALLPASNTWITTPGEDEESDDRLVQRCVGRWARLSYANTDGAYRGWALEALPALTRVTIGSAPGDGNITIVGATALGPITAPQADAIEDYINGVLDGIGRRPLNDIVTAVPATTLSSPAITITAYVVSTIQDTAAASITQAVLDYIGSIPIGGVVLLGTQGRVLFSRMLKAAQDVEGVVSVEFASETDVMLAVDQIYTPTITVNIFTVAPGVA